MGLRFRKSVKIAPGVRATIGKKSTSISIGTNGARRTISTTGRKTTTVGVPGTGLSHVTTSSAKKHSAKTGAPAPYSPRTYKACGVILLILAVLCFLIGLVSIAVGGWVFLLIGAPCLVFGLQFLKKGKRHQEGEGIQ